MNGYTRSVLVLPFHCVMSSAYWNRAIIQQNALINAQAAEYVPVVVETAGEERVPVGAVEVMATRYELMAGMERISVWSGPSADWVGLESEVKGGRKLRYVLAERPGTGSHWADVRAASGQGES